MASRTRPPAEALLEQSRTVAGWLRSLDEDALRTPSALDGWTVRQLAGHLVFAHRTLRESLGRRTADRALPVHVYVQGYRPNADQIADASRSAADVDDVVSALDAEIEHCTEVLAGGLPAVALGPRGPIAGEDLVRTRIVEVVVHSDDLSRSLPEREPVPLRRPALGAAVRTLTAILADSTRAVRSRCGCRRTPRCSAASATRDRPTPGARHPTWSRPIR